VPLDTARNGFVDVANDRPLPLIDCEAENQWEPAILRFAPTTGLTKRRKIAPRGDFVLALGVAQRFTVGDSQADDRPPRLSNPSTELVNHFGVAAGLVEASVYLTI
jgi:hypothetical protein